ncbi:MAG: hypothetical protein ABIY55_10090, partial [Kofleriaceae bacterium]
GDPWYLGFGFADELAPWIAGLPAPARDAIGRIRTRLKAGDHLMSAYLSLVLSAADPRTLADLRHLTDDDAAWAELRRRYLATPYGADDDFTAMQAIRPDLGQALQYLEAAGFPAYWQAHALPQVQAAIAEQGPAATRYDVIGADEALLGRRLDTDRITAFVLAYVRPHGIRITGWRFLNDFKVPLKITVKTALHELLHPPFPRTGAIDALLVKIEQDPYFQRLVKDHDPAFGYTTAPGLLEEDLVTAIDVYNAHHLGLIPDLAGYWPAHDDGIHVVAFLLVQQLERNHRAGETYPDFLLRLEREHQLRPGALEAQFLAEPTHYVVKALQPAAAQ